MSKEAVFTLKLESDLRAAFMAEAATADRPASQIMRELMRDYVRHRRAEREYDELLHQKVDLARSSARAGSGRVNDEVEARFKVLRDDATRQS